MPLNQAQICLHGLWVSLLPCWPLGRKFGTSPPDPHSARHEDSLSWRKTSVEASGLVTLQGRHSGKFANLKFLC